MMEILNIIICMVIGFVTGVVCMITLRSGEED
jgi:hypothetical protein